MAGGSSHLGVRYRQGTALVIFPHVIACNTIVRANVCLASKDDYHKYYRYSTHHMPPLRYASNPPASRRREQSCHTDPILPSSGRRACSVRRWGFQIQVIFPPSFSPSTCRPGRGSVRGGGRGRGDQPPTESVHASAEAAFVRVASDDAAQLKDAGFVCHSKRQVLTRVPYWPV